MTLIGSMGRWHGRESVETLQQSEREAKQSIERITQEIADHKAMLGAHREHLARIQRQLAALEANRG